MSQVAIKQISKKKIITWLIIIGLISLSFKLYLVDFSLPETGDSWIYILRGIANSQGNYAETVDKTQGWHLFLSIFFMLVNSDNYVDYVTIARIVSISLSAITIIPMYILARKFFSQKYSLVAASLFAFQPQLNYNSILGFSETLFILVFVCALNFLLNKSLDKNVFLSFFFLGILFWSRFQGILLVPALIIVYFIHYRNSKKLLTHFVICTVVFLIVISPILSVRYSQYGNPLYFENIDVKAISNSSDTNFYDVLSVGFSTMMYAWGVSSLPYLIFLFPLGLALSFTTNNEKKNMISMLIMLSAVLFSLLPVYYSMNEGRMLFHLYPIMIIFATYAIQKINQIETHLTFIGKKNLPLICIMTLVVASSILVTHGIDGYGYGRPDPIKVNEIREYNRFLLNTLDGKLLWSKGVDPDWIRVTLLEESNGKFKNYKITTDHSFRYFDDITPLNPTGLYVLSWDELIGNSIEEYILNGENIGLRYISVGEDNDEKFFDELYHNEKKFGYLTKIFDSMEKGFQKYKVKTFEINYEKFHLLYDKTT